MAWRVGRSLLAASLGLLVTSGLFYLAVVLLVRGDWPAEAARPEGFVGVVFRLWEIVNVTMESSAPTCFNALLWSLLGLTAVAAAALARRRAGWVALAAIAFLASLDETIALHERLHELGWPLAQAFGWAVAYAWVLPGVVLAAVVAVALWPLVRALPTPSRRLILLGGAAFLLGAIVLETVSGQLVSHFGTITWHATLVAHAEELLEKVGIILAMMGVVRLFSVQWDARGGVRIVFDDPEGARAARQAAAQR